MVIISDNQETTEFLKLRALAIQTPLTDDDIYRWVASCTVCVIDVLTKAPADTDVVIFGHFIHCEIHSLKLCLLSPSCWTRNFAPHRLLRCSHWHILSVLCSHARILAPFTSAKVSKTNLLLFLFLRKFAGEWGRNRVWWVQLMLKWQRVFFLVLQNSLRAARQRSENIGWRPTSAITWHD